MLVKELRQKLKRQELDADQIAGLILEEVKLLRAAVDGIYLEKPRAKYTCVRALRIVSRIRPRLLYPYFNLWVDLLSDSDVYIQSEIIYIVANLARVDTQNKIDDFLDAYFEPLAGPSLLPAMCVVKGASRLLRAKPNLREKSQENCCALKRGNMKMKPAAPLFTKPCWMPFKK